MNSQSFRFETRAGFRWAAFLGGLILLTMTAGFARHFSGPAGPGRTVRVHGRRLAMGLALGKMGRAALAPTSDEERGEAGGDEHARLLRWIESRHPAAPGMSWGAVEAANREAAGAWAAAQARGAQPVWRERGPLNMTGATLVTAVRGDGRTLLVGSSRGNLFSGTPGGRAWTPITSNFGEGFIAGLKVSSPPETWAVAIDRAGGGGALYVSRNHGVSWSAPKGLPPLLEVDELVQEGGDRRTLYLLAWTAQSNGSALPILARSRDGGVSFAIVRRWSSGERPGLWTSRTGAGPLYLMSGGQLAVSTDHGSSFSPLGPVFDPKVNYVILRGSEAGAPTLYAAVGRDAFPNQLYVSEDGGLSWEKRYSFDEANPFGGALTASIQDPNLVLFGNTMAWRSTDGGRTFAKINDWGEYYDAPASRLHADVRGLEVALYRGRETLFLDTDGGSYLSTDGGESVSNLTLNGLGNAQFYSTWSSASADAFLAGSQDQGFQQTLPPAGGRAGAPLGTVQRVSGDYTGLTSATHDLTNVFALYPGLLLLFAPGGDASSLVLTDLPATATTFASSLAADPDDPSTVYVGGDHIWRMTYQGGEDFLQTELPQSFAGDSGDMVTALTLAPSDHRTWYAATRQGHIWSSRDHGVTWSDWDAARYGAPFMTFLALRVSDTDPLTCFAAGGGYGTPPSWVTHDGGASWSPAAKGLPQTVVWSLAFDGTAAHTLYAATEAGPYVLNAASSTWRSLLGGGAPIIPYTSVEGVPATHLMRFGTFGRGVWDYVAPGHSSP